MFRPGSILRKGTWWCWAHLARSAGQPIRPEHITLDGSQDTLSVDLTEALGGVSYACLVAETGEKIVVEERGDERSSEGTRLGITFDVDRAMLFDRKSEARIR